MTVRGRPRGFDREAALERAMRLFWERGYENASLSGLTSAMGIKGPSLYAAFGSKEELFRECLERYQAEYGISLAEAAGSELPARERIRSFLETCAREYTRADVPRGCFVVLAALHCSSDNQEVSEMLKRQRLAGQELLRGLLREAIASGELPPETDDVNVAAYFAALTQGMSIQAKDGATRETLLAAVQTALAFWPEPSIPPDKGTGTEPGNEPGL